MSRLPTKPRTDLTLEQQKVHDKFASTASLLGPSGSLTVYQEDNGAFIGPFPFQVADPSTGSSLLDLIAGLGKLPLPNDAKEVAILLCAGHFQAVYPLYAHTRIATRLGILTEGQVDAIKAGNKPGDLNGGCSIAFDTAKYLLNTPGPLPQHLWDGSVQAFGKEGMVALLHYIGFYMWMSIGANACDVPAP